MAKIRVSKELLSDMLFGCTKSPVTTAGCEYDPDRGIYTFEISGPDVPEADEVVAIVHVQQNRRGDKPHEITFEAA